MRTLLFVISLIGLTIAFHQKRGLVGAPEEIDPQEVGKDPMLKQALADAVRKINDEENGVHLLKLNKIYHAREQVVQGMLYHLTVELGRTSCMKNLEDDSACTIQPNSVMHTCQVKIWVRPWMPEESKGERVTRMLRTGWKVKL